MYSLWFRRYGLVFGLCVLGLRVQQAEQGMKENLAV